MTLSDVAEMRFDCPMCNAENVAFNINLEDQTVHCPECDECESLDDFRDRINAYTNWVAVLNWLEGKEKKTHLFRPRYASVGEIWPSLPPFFGIFMDQAMGFLIWSSPSFAQRTNLCWCSSCPIGKQPPLRPQLARRSLASTNFCVAFLPT
jgi:hypothetical protein